MFTAVLFTKARIWRHQMSIDRWMDKEAVGCVCVCVCVCTLTQMHSLLWPIYIYTHTHIYIFIYMYNGILLSHKKECIWVSSNEVDEPRAYYTEWSQKEKNKYHILIHIYGIYKDDTDEFAAQQWRQRWREQTYGQGLQKGRRGWIEWRE